MKAITVSFLLLCTSVFSQTENCRDAIKSSFKNAFKNDEKIEYNFYDKEDSFIIEMDSDFKNLTYNDYLSDADGSRILNEKNKRQIYDLCDLLFDDEILYNLSALCKYNNLRFIVRYTTVDYHDISKYYVVNIDRLRDAKLNMNKSDFNRILISY